MSKVFGILNLYDSPDIGEMTSHRALGSLSFLGRYAIMDFALSNFTNSKIDTINILLKNHFRSVSRHVGNLKTWTNNTKLYRQHILINERGIADPKFNSDINALRENEWAINEADPDYIVIQPAHIITTIDLHKLVKAHKASGKDLTVAYTKIKEGKSTFLSSNVLKIKDNLVVSSVPNDGKKDNVDVSLRTYVLSREFFKLMLKHEDFRDALSLRMLIEKIVNENHKEVNAYEYKGFSRCIDTFENYMKYSFELLDPEVVSQLIKKDWPIYTLSHNSRPTIYGKDAKASNSFVANGCLVEGEVKNSILARKVHIEKGAKVVNSIILYGVNVKKGAVIENALVDKNSTITDKVIGDEKEPKYVKQGDII